MFAEVWAALPGQGPCLHAARTVHRFPEKAEEVRERHDRLRHPAYKKPKLLAEGPNQV